MVGLNERTGGIDHIVQWCDGLDREQVKQSGKPAVLTVNGQAEVVVQSAEAYQRLLDDQRLLETLRGISRGLEQANRGEGRPMRALLEELAAKRGIGLK